MFTRFQTASRSHLFNAPLIKVSPGLPGSLFLAALGGAYEQEESHLRLTLLRSGAELKAALEQPPQRTLAGVPPFIASLTRVIEFLTAASESTVTLYSYERRPSIDDILQAFAQGSGANDWAIEELASRGDKGRKALLSVLKKERDKGKLLVTISLLLIVFRDNDTVAEVRSFVQNCEPDFGHDASMLLAAYTEEQRQNSAYERR